MSTLCFCFLLLWTRICCKDFYRWVEIRRVRRNSFSFMDLKRSLPCSKKPAILDGWMHFRHCDSTCGFIVSWLFIFCIFWNCASCCVAALVVKLKEASDDGLTAWTQKLMYMMHKHPVLRSQKRSGFCLWAFSVLDWYFLFVGVSFFKSWPLKMEPTKGSETSSSVNLKTEKRRNITVDFITKTNGFRLYLL